MEPLVRCLLALAIVGLLLDAAGAVLLVVCWRRMRARHEIRMQAALDTLRAALALVRVARSSSSRASRS